MSDNEIIMYGTTWCGDCRRSKNFLDANSIPYKWVDVDEDREGLAYVREVNNGIRIVPTILFSDGDILVEPTNAQLGAKLGLS